MLPSSQPEGRLVIAYPISLPDPAPSYDDAYALAMLLRKRTKDRITVNGGCSEPPGSTDWAQPMMISTLYLGVTVACAYGEADTASFSIKNVRAGFTKLEKQVARYKNICAELHEAHPCVPEDLFDGTPTIAFLFLAGESQSASDLVRGTCGQIERSGDAWKITVDGDARLGRELTATANERFTSGDPEDDVWPLREWLDGHKRISTHGRLDWGSLGFLVANKNICSHLEGVCERTFTLAQLEAHATNRTTTFIIRTDNYG